MFEPDTEYYIWGAGTYGKRLIRFMDGKVSFKAVIDNSKEKQGGFFEDLSVIGFDQAKAEFPYVKIVIAQVYPNVVRDFLMNEGYKEYKDFVSIYDFVPRWFWHNEKKLVPKVVNFVASNWCTLSCDGCQSFMQKLKHPKTATPEELIADIDLLFSNIDFLFLINVCCGESLVNKSLSMFVRHTYEKYKGRYGSLAILTNGTIVPDDAELKAFAECEAILSISDYSEGNPKIKASLERLVAKCEEHGVTYYLNTSSDQSAWYYLGDPDIITESSPATLKLRYEACFKLGCGIRNGILYTCQAQNAAIAVAEVPGPEAGDYYDLHQSIMPESKESLYKIISRNPDKGYLSHCARCNGTKPTGDCFK